MLYMPLLLGGEFVHVDVAECMLYGDLDERWGNCVEVNGMEHRVAWMQLFLRLCLLPFSIRK